MKNGLSAIIKNQYWNGSPVIYKTAEEMLFLHGWLSKENLDLSSLSEESIDSMILKCEKCKQTREKKKGFGTGENKIAVILNRPVLMNRIEMNLYKTESVDLLRKMVKAIGFDLEECYTTNLIKCESDDAFTKPSDMIKNCTAILEKELNYYKPVIVIVMGEILPLQEVVKKSTGISWFNTEHPVSLLKNNDLKRPAWETLKLVKKKYAELKK